VPTRNSCARPVCTRVQVPLELYRQAMRGVRRHLVRHFWDGTADASFVSEATANQNTGQVEPTNDRFEHLTCFAGGMFLLGALNGLDTRDAPDDFSDKVLAARIGRACYELYHQAASGLAPDSVTYVRMDGSHLPSNQEYFDMLPATPPGHEDQHSKEQRTSQAPTSLSSATQVDGRAGDSVAKDQLGLTELPAQHPGQVAIESSQESVQQPVQVSQPESGSQTAQIRSMAGEAEGAAASNAATQPARRLHYEMQGQEQQLEWQSEDSGEWAEVDWAEQLVDGMQHNSNQGEQTLVTTAGQQLQEQQQQQQGTAVLREQQLAAHRHLLQAPGVSDIGAMPHEETRGMASAEGAAADEHAATGATTGSSSGKQLLAENGGDAMDAASVAAANAEGRPADVRLQDPDNDTSDVPDIQEDANAGKVAAEMSSPPPLSPPPPPPPRERVVGKWAALSNDDFLRPEAIETLFYLWRASGDPIYREWGWNMFRAFERWGRLDSGGYTTFAGVQQARHTLALRGGGRWWS
jgi:Glycosyl hydrolase family 47